MSAPPLQSPQLPGCPDVNTLQVLMFEDSLQRHTRTQGDLFLATKIKAKLKVPGITDVLTDKRAYKHQSELHKTADTKENLIYLVYFFTV